MTTIHEILTSTTRPDGKPVAVLRDASIDMDSELSDTDTQLLHEMLSAIKSAIAATCGTENPNEWNPCDFAVYRIAGDPDQCCVEYVEGFGDLTFRAVYSTEWATEHAEIRGKCGGTDIKIEEYGEELSARLHERAESEYPVGY